MKNPELKQLKKSLKKVNPILKEFREFVNRGNVLDLAVGVIVGGAFNKIISSLVNDLVMPIVGLVLGGIDFTHLELTIPNFFGINSAAHIRYGTFIQNFVSLFLSVSLTNFQPKKNPLNQPLTKKFLLFFKKSAINVKNNQISFVRL